MRDKLLAFLRENAMLPPGSTVFCALSGGADSTALTHCLFSLRDVLDIRVCACHFNHRLRGAESDGDEAFCREFCRTLGIPLTVGSGDVRSRQERTGESLEEAARKCRYAFFDTLPGPVATAHTADDDLETFLLAVLRGTGLKGLGGIPPVRGKLIRPMLTVTRDEVLAYLRENGLPHREDSTNAADSCVRNRLRHSVIPLLRAENPSLAPNAVRMMQLLRADEALLQAQADPLLCGSEEGGWDIAPLRAAPAPLRQRALRTMLSAIRAPKLSASHISAVEALVLGDDPSAQAALPGGWTAERRYDLLLLRQEGAPLRFAPCVLPCPGSVFLPETGMTVTVLPAECGIAASAVENGEILVRARQTGDSIRLSGGSRSLKKLYIDRRVPLSRRDVCPVLESGGRVLAAYPFGLNAEFAAKPGEPAFTIRFEEKEEKPS